MNFTAQSYVPVLGEVHFASG